MRQLFRQMMVAPRMPTKTMATRTMVAPVMVAPVIVAPMIVAPMIVAMTLMMAFGAVAVAAPGTGGPDAAPQSPAPQSAAPSAKHAATPHPKPLTVEQRIAELHTSLGITAAEQPQWDQFAQVMRANAQDMDASFKARIKDLRAMTAPENMQSYAQVAMGHAQDVQKLVPVFQALYDTMSDSQKHNADAVFRHEAHHAPRGSQKGANM